MFIRSKFNLFPSLYSEQNSALFYALFSAEAIAQKLNSIDLPGREYQTYVVGSGVTEKGTKKLAKMLACMTVGDLDALLHLKNIDPAKVTQLLKDIQELAKALVIFPFPNILRNML